MNKEILNHIIKRTGKTPVPVEILPLREVLKGQNFIKAMEYSAVCKRGDCHFNAAMAIRVLHLDGYKITFVEGLLDFLGGMEHCWNKLTDLKTGKSYFVDFTLGANKNALLLEEWGKDICTLFDRKRVAFIPFRDWYHINGSKDKRLMRLYARHYPKYLVLFACP